MRRPATQLDVTDWFVVTGQVLLVAWLIHDGNHVAAVGCAMAASNYYTARRRYSPELHS